jgi:hypothetical protein
MRKPKYIIEHFINHMGMFIVDPTYDNIVSFINGCEAAFDGIFLDGFQGWVSDKSDNKRNLHWSAQILDLAFPDAEVSRHMLLEEKNDKFAQEFLVSLIREFFDIAE